MLMLLAKFEFDGWFHFFKNKEFSKKIGFPLKLDDVCMNEKVNKVHCMI